MNKTWNIPVTWEMMSVITVEADNLEEAIKIARDDEGKIPLPDDGGTYVDASWQLSIEDYDYIRECYNGGQADSEPLDANDTEKQLR